MKGWIVQHAQAMGFTLRRLVRAPVASLLNILVMGIALSLPAGAYVLLENLQALSGQVNSAPQVSLFLALDAARSDVEKTEARLKSHPEVKRYRFVPRDQALADLKRNAGLADVVESLKQNPLPDAFVVDARSGAADALERLSRELRQWPKVEHVQLDTAWARRLDALLQLGRLAVLALATLLAFTLVAVTFNTIRLQVLTQRDEIEVAKLIGATDGFIRRPFLYFGALQGLAGGIAAWVVIGAFLALLNGPLSELSQLYAASLYLRHLPLQDSLSLLGFSAWLGWLGAWLSVSKHLQQVNPA
ncbi:MAG: ABC transporter permease [Betaproteobacteria bacterium]|nr:ABC transporter permease [Betaproteobacteria bacterium]